MKRLLLAITLVCVLSGTALAGDIPGVDSTAPAPPQPSAVVTVLLTIISVVVK